MNDLFEQMQSPSYVSEHQASVVELSYSVEQFGVCTSNHNSDLQRCATRFLL